MRAKTEGDYRKRILRVLVHLQEHLDEPIALEELAAVAGFSPYHFHRIFRGLVGESVKEHLRRLRLERAAHRLQFSRRSLLALALEAGYETHESFTRAFRARFGMTPSAYRRQATRRPPPEGDDQGPALAWETISLQEKEGELAVEVTIQELRPMRVAFVRHVGPYADCGAAWDELCAWAARQGQLGPNTRFLGIGYDDPEITPADKIRYDACVTVEGEVVPEGAVGVQEIAGGEYAVVVHRGPLEGLKETYRQLFRDWVPQSGRELRSAPCFELYRNDPATTPPEELRTEIYLPLEPR